jgi:hypothetical protein
MLGTSKRRSERSKQMAINFTYDRKVGELILKADGFVFGRLYDCEVAWLFEAHSLQLEEDANSRFEADFSIAEKLAAIKAAYIDYDADGKQKLKQNEFLKQLFITSWKMVILKLLRKWYVRI